jgi:phosphohistidine phosphatase
MKTLYFIRHAKSSWDYPQLSDDERPLTDSGIKRTKKLGIYLNEKEVLPELIISSHANRAFHTAQIIAKKINFPVKNIKVERSIYSSGIDNIFSVIYGISDDYNSVMLFGHNPTFTNLANYFLNDKIENLPTSGFVCVEFETEHWNEIVNSKIKDSYVVFPKKL